MDVAWSWCVMFDIADEHLRVKNVVRLSESYHDIVPKQIMTHNPAMMDVMCREVNQIILNETC